MKRMITPLVLTILFGLMAGCGEKDVPYVIDSEEITRYVREVGIANELFRNSGLINPTPYTLPSDNATYYDSLVSVRRSIEVLLVPLKIRGPNGDSIPNYPHRIYQDYGILGQVREGLARVDDRFTIHITRVYADTVLHDTTVLRLERYGFFLKLGTDTRPYVGWLLWGFNGGVSSFGATVSGSGGVDFNTATLYQDNPLSNSNDIPDIAYVRLTALDTVLAGSRLLVTVPQGATGSSPRLLLSDYDDDGAFTRPMVRYYSTSYNDSLSFQTPTNNPRLYNQMLIQSLSSQFPHRTGFVVPYRR